MVTAEDVRELALALPATTEKTSWGMPGFRVADRLFARIRVDLDALLVWCGSVDEKEFLLAADSAKLFTTPHYDGHPTVLVRLAAVGREELAELLADSWRVRAPRRLVAELDARR